MHQLQLHLSCNRSANFAMNIQEAGLAAAVVVLGLQVDLVSHAISWAVIRKAVAFASDYPLSNVVHAWFLTGPLQPVEGRASPWKVRAITLTGAETSAPARGRLLA